MATEIAAFIPILDIKAIHFYLAALDRTLTLTLMLTLRQVRAEIAEVFWEDKTMVMVDINKVAVTQQNHQDMANQLAATIPF